MPDTSWICPFCGENNPPYTEACRNCCLLSATSIEQSVVSPETTDKHGHVTSNSITPSVSYPPLFLAPRITERLYYFAATYTLLTAFAREEGVLLIEVLTFGVPVLLFLFIEWVAPVLIAALVGFQNKWSFKAAIRALPLVVTFACISPCFSGKNITLPVYLPWMAAAPASVGQAIDAIVSRSPFWAISYGLALALGYAMRLKSKKSCESKEVRNS